MAFFHEPGNGLRPAFDVELVKNIRQVVFYRFVAQTEMDGDLLVCFSLSEQRQNEAFLRGESGDAL